jgi:hypothetical protein
MEDNLGCLINGHHIDIDRLNAYCVDCGKELVCMCDVEKDALCKWVLIEEAFPGA